MYTSNYSSSPVRTSTSETKPTNYQTQTYQREYYRSSNNINNNNINTMNDNNLSSRRDAGGYGNSSSSLISIRVQTPTSSRKYPNHYTNVPNDSNRYQSTAYSPSNRPYRNDTDTFLPNTSRYDLSGNVRAYSYDNLFDERSRSQSSMYNPRGTNQYGQQQQQQQQQTRREQYNDYDDDDLIVKSTDLPASYEQEMINLVRTAFRKYQITNQRELAGFLKRAADKTFSPCWHCIVGKQFSSYVTHEMNGFIYFTKGPLSILLFKSGV